MSKVQAVRLVASALHAPEDWHFVIVCGEEGWKDYASYAKGSRDALMNGVAETNVDEHETFLREERLDPGNTQGFREIIAHEIASALVHSKDETFVREEMKRIAPDLQTTAKL